MARRILVVGGSSDLVRLAMDSLDHVYDLRLAHQDTVIVRDVRPSPIDITKIHIGPIPIFAPAVNRAPIRGPERPVRPPAERVRGVARRKR